MHRDMANSIASARVVCACLALAGCGITDFDVEQPVQEQTIQGSGIPAPLAAIFPLPLSLDLDAKIKAKDTGPIDSVSLSSLSLHITSSASDWSFVTSVDVSVSSTRSGTSLPKVKIASVSSPGAVQTMNFHGDAADAQRDVRRQGGVHRASAVTRRRTRVCAIRNSQSVGRRRSLRAFTAAGESSTVPPCRAHAESSSPARSWG
ncbi:MAG: hypothetical protein E6J90_43515 [Deltaproteobacteria bacterium]|nr:MAG: hypothetical protein E6J90_43515 [Deltaproteobacteria bacterium]